MTSQLETLYKKIFKNKKGKQKREEDILFSILKTKTLTNNSKYKLFKTIFICISHQNIFSNKKTKNIPQNTLVQND
jgi:hypothetical protein